MSKEIYISSTPHETRLAIVESDELTEIYYERENEYTLAGSIYNGKVTRVLPGMQSSFVDIGLERDAFLYITDFMEEAADTAEFDHSGDGPRPARSESQRSEGRADQGRNGRDRDQGRNGNDRSDGYVSERNREQISASPATDMARASEGREEESGGRNDRGGRASRTGTSRPWGKWRSFQRPGSWFSRDEGTPRFMPRAPFRNRRTQAGPDEDQLIEALPGKRDRNRFSTQNGGAELGEGAPGADGSRRWRGRRGRRRGRGTEPQDGVASIPHRAGCGVARVFPPRRTTQTGDEGIEQGTSLECRWRQTKRGLRQSRTRSPPLSQRQGIRSTQPDSRDQDQERQRDRVADEAIAETVAAGTIERTEASAHREYPVDSRRTEASTSSTEENRNSPPTERRSESVSASGAEPEPLILPGESLSKYRKGGEEAAAARTPAASVSAAMPEDSGFKIDPNWDGSAMLPGETLSRYRGGASQPGGSYGRSEARVDSKRQDGRRDGGRDRQADRPRESRRNDRERPTPPPTPRQSSETPDRHQPMMVPSSVPGVDLQSAGPVSGYSHVSETAEEIQPHQPEFVHAELPQATAEAPTMDDRGLAHQPGEQTHGSTEQIDAAQAVASTEPRASEHEYEPEGQSVSYRVDPSAPSEYRQTSSSAVEEVSPDTEQHVEVAPSGEVYVADAPGVLSDISAASATDEHKVLPGLTGDAGESEFLRHSHAVAKDTIETHEITMVHPEGEMTSGVASDDPIEEEAHAQGFAPGAGDLEEDFIEEDDLETTSLHAHGDEEFDDLEEEHLEGTADLGMMIRDMSLDHITRTDGALTEDEEDDFEEDTLEEDSETEEQDSPEGFDTPEGETFEEQAGAGFRSESADSAPSTSGNERRGRRDRWTPWQPGSQRKPRQRQPFGKIGSFRQHGREWLG